MGHGPEHHIEHAEHATHAKHDHFDRTITITIAIIAAVLAAVTMLGHTAHNNTLIRQGEALHMQTEGNLEFLEAVDTWAMYQAKRIRMTNNENTLKTLEFMGAPDKKAEIQAFQKELDAKINEHRTETKDHLEKAKKQEEESKQWIKNSQKKMEESHFFHAQGSRFDMSELVIQLGLVLCSLAILTKSKPFYWGGIICTIVGILIACTAIFGLFLGVHSGH